MATNFPTSADDAATVGGDSKPAAGTALSDSTAGHPSHSDLHENVGDAVQAVEAKVGTGSSAPAANTVLTGTGSGTSGWATVSTAMIGDTQVTTAKLADDAVTAAKLASNAVVTASIVDDNVTQAKIADDAVGADQLASDAVVTASIVDDAVTAAKIHDDAVTKVVVADTTDTSCSVALFESATGSLPPKTDGGLTYNAGTGALTATAFVGPLTGNVTGTLQTAAQANITSVGTLDDLTVTGVLDANGVVKITDGSVGSPALTFDSDENSGLYAQAADQPAISSGGSISLIGTAGTVNTAGLATSSTTGYQAVYRNETFGTLYRFTSSADVKENITNVVASDAGAWIDALQPVTFNERWLQEGDEPADNKAWREADVQVGFIADDVLANSTTSRFAQVSDNNGTLKGVGWKFECVLAATVAELKSVRARLEALEG